MAVAGAPSVEHELAFSHERYFFFAFALPLVVAAALEATVVALSDRLDRKRVLAIAQGALAASLFATAISRDAWTLAFALAAAGTTSGVACGVAQAAMIAKSDHDADRAMLAWSLYASFGDILTPILTAAALASGHTYRFAMALVGAVVLAQSIGTLACSRNAAAAGISSPPDDSSMSISQAFSRAIRMPRLWLWLFASASCTLLDEIVVAIVALRLAREGHASAAVAALAAVFFALGAAIGAHVTDRVMRRARARQVLLVTAMASLVALAALVSTHTFAAAAIALFALGLVVAAHHPLSLARAYAMLPGNPGVVQACVQLFVAIDVGAPLAVGALSDRFGLGAALASLALQPLVILACALSANDATETS